jgi:integrase
MKRHLTELSVQRFRIPKSGQTEIFDLGYPGLALRIGNGGAKSFVVFHRHGGKLHRITLGRWPEVTLGAAREGWRRTREAIARGEDPTAGNGKPAGSAFELVVEDWLKRDIGTRARPGTLKQVSRIIDHDLLPAWRGRRIDAITKKDVIALLDAIADRGAHAKAELVYTYLSRLFKWLRGRSIITVNPMDGLERPTKSQSRDRVLTDDELARVWRACDNGPYGYAFKLLALTGLRREQVGRLRWSEIEGDTIHLDGLRTKNGDPQLVPLSKAAQGVLSRVPRIGDDFVFTFDGDKPINSWGRAKDALDKASGVSNWRTHDLRRTLATGMQKLGIIEPVVEAVLGHTTGRKRGIVRVYQKHDYAAEKREAVERWGEYVMGLVS